MSKLLKYYRKKTKWTSRFTWRPLMLPFTRDKVDTSIMTQDERKEYYKKYNMKVNMKHKNKTEGKIQISKFISETAGYVKYRKNIENKISRKIKSIWVPKLQSCDGTIYKKYKKMNLGQFKKHFGLSKKGTPVIGFTPDHCGYRPGKSVPSYTPFSQFIDYNQRNQRKRIIKHPYYKTVLNVINQRKEAWAGSYDTNSNGLKKFFAPNTTKRTEEDIINIISKCNWFQHSDADFSNPIAMFVAMNYNPEASNGHYTSKLLNSSKKGATRLISLQAAYCLYDTICKKPMKNYAIWDILSREKVIKTTSSEPATRIVWTTEEAPMYILSWISNTILREYQVAQNTNFKAPILGEFDAIKMGKIMEKIDKYDYIVDADWSQFDATIDTPYLVVAGLVMMSNIASRTPEDMRISFYYISSLTTKFLVIPPGIVVNSGRGNPSGHPGVTIINCLVNMMRWAIIGYKIYGDSYAENMEVFVYGDDSFILFKKHANLLKIDKFSIEEGFIGDPIVPNLFPVKLYHSNEDNTPDFLKRRFNMNGIYWNVEKVLVSLIFPSKKRNIYEEIDTAYNFVITAPCDNNFNELILLYIYWVRNKYTNDDDVKDHCNKKISMIDKIIAANKNNDVKTIGKFNYYLHTHTLAEKIEENTSRETWNVAIYKPNMIAINKEFDISIKRERLMALYLLNYNSSEAINSYDRQIYDYWDLLSTTQGTDEFINVSDKLYTLVEDIVNVDKLLELYMAGMDDVWSMHKIMFDSS